LAELVRRVGSGWGTVRVFAELGDEVAFWGLEEMGMLIGLVVTKLGSAFSRRE